MRFFTFLKEYYNEAGPENQEVITFAKWIYAKEYPKNNPHAGLQQVKLALLSIEHSNEVWVGFVKTCVGFHEKHPDSLPIPLKKRESLLEFLGVTEAELIRFSKPW